MLIIAQKNPVYKQNQIRVEGNLKLWYYIQDRKIKQINGVIYGV